MKASQEDEAAKVVCYMETSALMKGHMEVGSFPLWCFPWTHTHTHKLNLSFFSSVLYPHTFALLLLCCADARQQKERIDLICKVFGASRFFYNILLKKKTTPRRRGTKKKQQQQQKTGQESDSREEKGRKGDELRIIGGKQKRSSTVSRWNVIRLVLRIGKDFFFSCPSPVREWLDAPCLDALRRWLTAGSPRCQRRMMNTWTAGRSGTQNNFIPRLYLSLSILNLFHLIPRFQMHQKRNNKVVGGGEDVIE